MKMKRAQASQSRGFTLIELLVTIGVLTILIVLGTPSFFDAIDRRRVVDATEALGKQVEQARMTAIETNRPITMVFDTGADWCFGLTDAATCDCSLASADVCEIPFSVDINLIPQDYEEVAGNAGQFPGLTLDSAPAAMRFAPGRGVRIGAINLGANPADPSDDFVETVNPVETIEITSPRHVARVMVNAIGRVSTCSPPGAGNISVMKTCPP
ncbi:Tfp pilus assembly protein FimT/FimU [Thioalkalivibrio sp. XN279]|uniref:pilus assembly FimT family protein n=1 Tax=Thioalkalivibrio sp. XN279 TaxID=2714953 RepID=UPI0014096321|nr:GspH/FimT family pseudopilin [Thioalkalivibrio sp. XN279]NHA15871.1 prepilin-type N-terminal cleavage/methylation domain-containing protein [Thioalkalivibrio sp. XN279]